MAGSPYTTPLLVRDGEQPRLLRRIPVAGKTGGTRYDEGYIQKLAFEYPSCLPIAEIDRAYEGLIPVCMELHTPVGPLDALYVTPTGRLVVLEAKLWRNPEARRKVVGQILDYAKELSRWDYADLQREVSLALKKKGNVLYEIVAKTDPAIDESAFVDEVETSLRRGRFLLLIVGDGIREGAAAIAEFLENVGSLEFTFGLVELALYEAFDAGVLVQPRVLARTVELHRTIVELRPGLSIVEGSAESDEDVEGTQGEAAQFYQSFWSEFLAELRLDDASQPLAKPNKTTNIFFGMPPSATMAWVSAYFAPSKQRVGVYLTFARGAFGDESFRILMADKEAIDNELGIDVEWIPEAASKGLRRNNVSRRKHFEDVLATANRPAIKAFFTDTVNRFVNVFRPRLERIAEESRDR